MIEYLIDLYSFLWIRLKHLFDQIFETLINAFAFKDTALAKMSLPEFTVVFFL